MLAQGRSIRSSATPSSRRWRNRGARPRKRAGSRCRSRSTAWTGLLAGGTHAGHATRELTSWDLGLAAGFLVLAWLPSRAWGALPVVAVIVALLAVTSAADLAAGRADLGREWVHGLQVAGLACLWVLARRAPRPPVVVRLRSARPA